MQKSFIPLALILNALAILMALVLSITRKNKNLRPVQLYLLSSMLFFLITTIPEHTPFGKISHYRLANSSVLVEISILYYYFYTLLTRQRQRQWLVICFLAFTSLVLYFWLGPTHAFDRFWGTLYGLENLFITIPCFFYFYQVFKSDTVTDFKTNPHFFVVSGLLFFYATTFPFYITYKIMYVVTPDLFMGLVIINHILSLILYSTIIKAYLCPQPAQK
jgi:hypothetical protein